MSAESRPALAAGAALVALYAALAITSPVSVGVWGDDAIYVATAQSLAEGEGYRHAELPDRPYQTKYPILYPAFLSLAFLASPEFPANVRWMVLPNALFGAGLVLLAALYLRRVFGASPAATWTAAALAAFSPALLAFVRYPMSELFYGCLAAGALVCLDHLAPSAGDARRARGWLVLGGVLVGLGALARSLGLTLAIAAVAVPLLRRRFADAALTAAVVALAVCPWLAWQAWAAGENGPLQSSFLVGVDLDYALWIPETSADALRVVQVNFFQAVFGFGFFQLALPKEFVGRAFSDGSWGTVLVHVACWVAMGLTVLGFVRSARGGLRALHLYALGYAALVLAWPFAPYRFYVPWTPFLLYFLIDGVAAFAVTAAGPRARQAALVGSSVLLAALFVPEALRIAGSTEEAYYLRETPFDPRELRDVESWLSENVGADEVMASFRPARHFLATGRRGVNFWTGNDPVAQSYGPDRHLRSFYAMPDGTAEPDYRDIRDDLREVYRDVGITWYVEYTLAPQAKDMARMIRERPSWFDLRHTTPGGLYKVYRLRLP